MCNIIDDKLSDCKGRDYTRYYCLNHQHCCGGRVDECRDYDPPHPTPPPSPECLKVGVVMKKAWVAAKLKHPRMWYCKCGELIEEVG